MKALVLLSWLVGCTGALVDPWQLDHDRIVAVRSTPPSIPAGATAQLDVLVANQGADVRTIAPDSTEVMAPASLASSMKGATVIAPSEAALAAARTELGLTDGAPVPLEVQLSANLRTTPRHRLTRSDQDLVIEACLCLPSSGTRTR